MKNWSFGKLVGVFLGVFLLVIAIAVAVIKATSSAPARRSSVPVQSQAIPQQPRMDVLSIELEKSKEDTRKALEGQQNAQQQLQIVRQESQRNTQILLAQLKQLENSVNSLDQRMDYFEASRQRVEIIKPPRKNPSPSQAQQLAESGKQLPASSGYKVQAVVGHRAWIKNGDHEDSVKPGDKLPPVQKELRVRAVDGDSGIVVTSPVR